MTRSIVHYVAGYGRSRSTVVGMILARREGALVVGEAHMARRSGSQSRICTCGQEVVSCPFWGSIVLDAISARNLRDIQLLESWISLFLPVSVLRWLILRVQVSSELSYFAWLRSHTNQANSLGFDGIVDTSKSTREAAARPLLYHLCGMQVRLYLPERPLREVIASVSTATRRRGETPSKLLPVKVAVSRTLSHFLTRLAAYRVTTTVNRIELTRNRVLNQYGGDHLIAGNRMKGQLRPPGLEQG